MPYEYNLRDYVPNYLKEDKDFGIFIDILQNVANDVKYFIDNFNSLIDPDTVPEIFLPKLSYLLSYQYKYQVNTSYQRELIKRMITIYQNKGTDNDILNAANNADVAGWLGDKLFYPGYKNFDNEASIMYPINSVFRHSISQHSMSDYYPDGDYWRYGVIVISVNSYSDKIRDAVMKVIPAGVRFYIEVVSQFDGDSNNGPIQWGKWVLDHEFIVTIHPELVSLVSGLDFSSTRYSDGLRYISGKKSNEQWIDYNTDLYDKGGRFVSNFKSNVYPVKMNSNSKVCEDTNSDQWGFSVYRSITGISLDAREIMESKDDPDGLVDTGLLSDNSDYTVGGIDLELV